MKSNMKISKDAQAVVYKKENGNVKFLLLKRYDKDKDETHYRLIKGGVKDPETTEHASIREVTEESGLVKLKINTLVNQYSYQAGEVQHNVDVYLIENTENEEIRVDSTEEGGFNIEGAEWLDAEATIEKLNFDQEKDNIRKSLELIN